MTLFMIGLGLNDEKDITVKGLETIKRCHKVFYENYTSILQCTPETMEALYGKKLILADRDLVEKHAEKILKPAKTEDVAFLVGGDVFSATTHTDLYLRALKEGVDVDIIHNASVISAIGAIGLEVYKYGKTASIPFPQKNFRPTSYYDIIESNQKNGAHTLLLLDIKSDENRFMTVSEGARLLLDTEEHLKRGVITKDTHAIGLARIGGKKKIIYAPLHKLAETDFGTPLHAIIIPGKLHFVEEEALAQLNIE
ncbi:MAG: diphthine synthase [Nanoarchaeota archaeon]